MAAFSACLLDQTLALVWSLWTELGVSGWQRRHTAVAIDPEPLTLFTATLANTDRRLLDEATDWCVRYGRYLSVARLRHLLSLSPEGVRAAFGPFAATVNAHAQLHWPEATEPRVYRRTGRSAAKDFGPAALVGLRLRALFGVSARAEIVGAFLAHPSATFSAAELAQAVAYTKRNVADALESLRMAGLLEVLRNSNQLRYRLTRPTHLAPFVGDLPAIFPVWAPIFRALWVIVEYAQRVERFEPMVAAVEAQVALRHVASDLQRAGVNLPTDTTGEPVRLAFERWAIEMVSGWAGGDPTFLAPRDTPRSFPSITAQGNGVSSV